MFLADTISGVYACLSPAEIARPTPPLPHLPQSARCPG